MNPGPSNRRKSSPATAVPPQRRNGHAQALSPGASARSGRLPRGHAEPPTPDDSRPDQPSVPYAGQRHLGESNHFLLLFL